MFVSVLLAGCLLAPIAADDGRVVRPFVPAPCEYCAGGHRGLDYEVADGAAVRAAAAGIVTFSGLVARNRYVVIAHPGDRRTTYGELATASVGVGDQVRAGQRIGTASSSLYFGLRRGDVAVDPAPLLAGTGHRARLVPGDGRPARPSPAREPTCAAPSEAPAGRSGVREPVAGTGRSRR